MRNIQAEPRYTVPPSYKRCELKYIVISMAYDVKAHTSSRHMLARWHVNNMEDKRRTLLRKLVTQRFLPLGENTPVFLLDDATARCSWDSVCAGCDNAGHAGYPPTAHQ